MQESPVSAQLESRRKVWLALSEFYLDMELMPGDFDRIAVVFRESGFSLSALKKIDLMEVFPLLQPNLLSAAGVWEGFDEAWLLQECEKRFRKIERPFYRFRCRFWNTLLYSMRSNYWKEIEKRMAVKP